MNLQKTLTYNIKYRKEENENEALRELINEEGVAKVTAIEQERVNRKTIKMEHCFRNEETHETNKGRKTPWWVLCTFKERRRNCMKGNFIVIQFTQHQSH